MKNSSKTYLKYNLFNFLNHPLFYIIAIAFSSITSIVFFKSFFTGDSSTNLINYFSTIPYICIIAIPALCFKRSDSIYDDFVPLNSFNKIFIRFLSIFILYTAIILFLIPISLTVNLFGTVDFGQIFTSIFCLLFYGAAVISLCLFICEIFNNDVSSFIVSAIILTFFNTAHFLTIYVSMNNFLSSLIKSLSFVWHFDAAGKGIIDTRDIIWFAGISVLFLLAAAYTKNTKNGIIRSKKIKTRNVLLIIINILVILNGSKYFKRLDFSKGKVYSLSKYTKQLLNSTEEQIKITYFRSGTLSKVYPQIRDVYDYLVSYSNQSDNVSFVLKDPDKDENAQKLLQNYGITTQPFKKPKNNNSVEYVNVYSAIIIEYNGNKELIPFIMSSATLEYDLDGRILHLIAGNERVVNIIVGNGLSLDDSFGYSYLIQILNSQGFVCNPLYTSDPDFTMKLSFSTGPLLILGDSETEIDQAIAIEDYILSKKGNALFAISPFSIDFMNWNLSPNKKTDLVEIIENWGVHFKNEIASDISCAVIQMGSDESSDDNYTQQSYRENLNYPYFISVLPQTNCNFGVTLFWPCAITLDDNVEPYLLSTNCSWNTKVDLKNSEKILETNPFYTQDFDISTKEILTQPLVAHITGKLNGLFTVGSCDSSDIIVIPDSYFLHTIMNSYISANSNFPDTRNFDFVINSLLKLNGEEELSKLFSKTITDTSLSKIQDEKSFIKCKNITKFVLIFIPVLILFTFIIILVIRIKKAKVVSKGSKK